MQKVQFITSVSLTSAFLLGLAMVRYPSSQPWGVRNTLESADSHQITQRPGRYAWRVLPLVAKSLSYLPKMEQAIAAQSPSSLAAEQLHGSEVTLFGVGPIQVGMTLEQASEALGSPLRPVGSNLSGECAYYQPQLQTQALGLMVVDDQIIRIDIWPGSTLKTVSGAHIGSSEQAIKDLYPGQIEVTVNPYIPGQVLTLVPKDPALSLYRMVFETDADGKVVQYRTGQFPAVAWSDGCA